MLLVLTLFMEEEPPPCSYCGVALPRQSWVSVWYDDFRYESVRCVCGHDNWQPAIDGSGHETLISGLESAVRIVCDVNCNK